MRNLSRNVRHVLTPLTTARLVLMPPEFEYTIPTGISLIQRRKICNVFSDVMISNLLKYCSTSVPPLMIATAVMFDARPHSSTSSRMLCKLGVDMGRGGYVENIRVDARLLLHMPRLQLRWLARQFLGYLMPVCNSTARHFIDAFVLHPEHPRSWHQSTSLARACDVHDA